MGHIMVNGAVGSGKSVVAQMLIDEMMVRNNRGVRLPDGRLAPELSEHLFSTVPLEGHDLPCVTLPRDRVYDAHCGTLFIDELQLHLGARDWEKMSAEAKDFWTRHRHYDMTVVSTTQHPSFVDKIARILTDVVWLVSRVSVPFLGHFVERSVRPPDWCSCPGCTGTLHLHRPELRNFYVERYGAEKGGELYAALSKDFKQHARRDALGDRHTWWQRFLGFGTLFIMREYAPSILGGEEMLNPEDLVQAGKTPKSVRLVLFDMKWAARAKRTVAAARTQSGGATRAAVDVPSFL